MNNIAQSLRNLHERITRAARASGRDPDAVLLLAVSKRRSADEIREALACGQRCFGENYLQEALEKIGQLRDLKPEWHYIGALQANKTSAVATHFDWVHSVCRAKIAQRLNEQRPPGLAPLNLCLQVNISGETTKSGVSPEQLPALAHYVSKLPRLRLRGLMALPAPSTDTATQRRAFAELRHCLERLQAEGLGLDTLSMGTSSDLEAAVMEGASIVRIGTDLFGPRAANPGSDHGAPAA